MEPWIGRVERYIAPDIALAERVVRGIGLEDLHVICGEKSFYSLADAKRLYKRQWTKDRYAREQDRQAGYSPQKMLDILRLRARYLIARGSTLNNPHIPSKYWPQFDDRILSVQLAKPKLRSLARASIRRIALRESSAFQ